MNKILDAIKSRLSFNPCELVQEFELGVFNPDMKNENDFLDLINMLNGMKSIAGIEYKIKESYFDRLGREHPFTLYSSHLCEITIKNKKKFDNFCKQIEQQNSGSSTVDGIYYNPATGIGYAHGKRFKFKNNQSDFFIFAEMYKNINQPIPRSAVLKMIDYEETGAKDTMATYKINEVTKKMRGMTGLDTDEIVNNNGALTLVGEKLASPPK
jgi:hypothetical protein